MPASDLHDPEDRDATGTKVKYLYCPDCGEYSGGGVCRRCETGLGEFAAPARSMISATDAAIGARGPDGDTTQQEALL